MSKLLDDLIELKNEMEKYDSGILMTILKAKICGLKCSLIANLPLSDDDKRYYDKIITDMRAILSKLKNI